MVNLAQWLILDGIRIEASSMCQLRCPMCPTGKGNNRKGVVGWGYLKFADFKKLVDDHPRIKWIELSNWGEIFLNPELGDIIKYAYDRGIGLAAGNGVNLNTVSEEILEYLVKYRFRLMTIAVDGASPETYGFYRNGGDFQRVISNIEKLNHYKQKYQSALPELRWQFVIFGHNEHELPIAREMARQMNMSFFPKLQVETWGPLASPVRNKEFVRKESGLGVATAAEYKQKYKREYILSCHTMWFLPQINWDGKLLGCCDNMCSDFGNVFESGLEKCLRSEAYIYAQKMLLGLAKTRDDIMCSRCHSRQAFRESLSSKQRFLYAATIGRRLC